MRPPGRFFWKLFLGNVILMALGIGVTTWLIFQEVERLHVQDLTDHLIDKATTIRPLVRGRMRASNRSAIDAVVKEIGTRESDGVRVTIVAIDGTVLGDSEHPDPADMDNHRHRPEIVEALAHGRGESRRYSQTVRREMKYVALRVGDPDAPEGVVRVAMTVRTITDQLGSARRLVWRIAWGALVGVVLLALGLARLWSSRLQRITAIARSLSQGDLSARASVSGSDEVAELGGSLNEMREKLSVQLGTIDRQRRTLEALLAQLQEAVVVTGPDGRIVLCNPSAQRLLGGDSPGRHGPSSWVGKAIEECIPFHDLQEMMSSGNRGSPATAEDTLAERRVRIRIGADVVYLLARASEIVLPGPRNAATGDPGDRAGGVGRLLALTDVTALERTISMKADFAANASHELRTPLSVIRAAVETVLSLDPGTDPQGVRHFLESINRQARRLEALVDDLLDLSRLESESFDHPLEAVDIAALIEEIRERYGEVISRKHLRFDSPLSKAPGEGASRGREDRILAPRPVLGMVIDNLVSNAVKFTDPGGSVTVRCERSNDSVTIEVADTGCGIAPAQQARVFERFYQVERARSGGGDEPSLRGTGLGLSIVRHAVAAMKGRIELHSMPGEGTRISVTIPQTPTNGPRYSPGTPRKPDRPADR